VEEIEKEREREREGRPFLESCCYSIFMNIERIENKRQWANIIQPKEMTPSHSAANLQLPQEVNSMLSLAEMMVLCLLRE
jgi:hypothetical protein